MRNNRAIQSPYNLGIDELIAISKDIRKSIFEICLNAGSGHLGGCSSSVELMVSLYFGGILKYDLNDPYNPERDRVLVRGHLGPLRYRIFSLLNYISENELPTYRSIGSRLQGHEDHESVPGVDITPSGSLGMLLSYGAGAALVARETKKEFCTFVFLGDGEEQEGNVSEAARHIAHLRLDNIIAILDKNGKQLSNPTHESDSANIANVWAGYGWEVIEIKDAHNIPTVLAEYRNAIDKKKPVILIANTIKGLGIKGAEDHFSGYHTIGVCDKKILQESINNLKLKHSEKAVIKKIKSLASHSISFHEKEKFKPITIQIEKSEDTSTNLNDSLIDYFMKLRIFLERDCKDKFPLFFLTADVTRRDHVEALKLKEFTKYFNVGIREQHMIALSHGISITNPKAKIIINSFDAFAYRSLDQLNALVQGGGSAIILGDVCGLSNGENGKSHQTAGQPGALLTMPGVTFLEPGDVRDLFNCLNWAIGQNDGVTYIRMHSTDIGTFNRDQKDLHNISYYIVYEPLNLPEVILVSSGLTVESCVGAAIDLEKKNIPVRVINVINQHSLGKDFVEKLESACPVMTVYNGLPQILQGSVARVVMDHGGKIPRRIVGHGFNTGLSGKTLDLLKYFKLDKEGIIDLIKENFLVEWK